MNFHRQSSLIPVWASVAIGDLGKHFFAAGVEVSIHARLHLAKRTNAANRTCKHLWLASTAAIKYSKFAPPMRARPLGIVLATDFGSHSIAITTKGCRRYYASYVTLFASYFTHSQSHNRTYKTYHRTRLVGQDRRSFAR